MSAVLKAGLIGLGSMGRHHARVLAGLEGVELVVTGVVLRATDVVGTTETVIVFDELPESMAAPLRRVVFAWQRAALG